ncbi:hypothetical protein D6C85_08564 [Aureobasidium pullulans]|uniref:C2H2-type domain-containing protein n=1 Tax=Aureobasidium pullulans TaxID=5580 RepID=A0A4V4KLB4_AURPU|nr:hypothetical protein D6D24_01022 [Aureobasidium pullulans]THZ25841.1 hypothetical protein D6C89_04131 [Aureobasidium pullulans]THZ64660.1 hypothetical protein D6C85_08564 [Aureobasidium pullulans]TIA22038.1 hypothetical protein D6C81_03546 [Aureobasidium pullulans]
MRDPKMYEATYELAHRRVANLSIDTNNFQGPSALISPPESANSARRSSYDMNFNHTPVSTYHPNTPVHHFGSQEMYNVGQTDKINVDLQYPPSPVDFSSGPQSYGATACNSPTWNSSIAFEQKAMDNSFYQESSTLLSTDQDWNSSTMSHYSNVDYAPDPSSLYMLPSQDPSSSFMADVDTSQHESLPSYIAPNQAVYQPELDHSMSLSGWGLQTPVHDHSILHSSSPAEYSPLTPSTLEHSFDHSYAQHDVSPSSSVNVHTTRSGMGKRGRKVSKQDKRKSIIRNVPIANSTSINFSIDKQAQDFYVNKIVDPNRKLHECPSCERKFQRSEHCKRHEASHADRYDFSCFISEFPLDPCDDKSQCKVGKMHNGKQNRNDNSRSHVWTHVKAWLVANSALVKEVNLSQNKKNRGRNIPISPAQLLKLCTDRDTPSQQDTVLKFLNGEAGKDLGVHILWHEKGCPVVRCLGGVGQEGGCTMCRVKPGHKKK